MVVQIYKGSALCRIVANDIRCSETTHDIHPTLHNATVRSTNDELCSYDITGQITQVQYLT